MPIRHVLGKSKMLLGLLEGIPTMLKGEVAMVTYYILGFFLLLMFFAAEYAKVILSLFFSYLYFLLVTMLKSSYLYFWNLRWSLFPMILN